MEKRRNDMNDNEEGILDKALANAIFFLAYET